MLNGGNNQSEAVTFTPTDTTDYTTVSSSATVNVSSPCHANGGHQRGQHQLWHRTG